MILVTAHAIIQKGKQADFTKLAQDCIAETRKEEGNISYTLLNDTENDCKFVFLEEWETSPHLDAHAKTKHFQKFAVHIEKLLEAPLTVSVYNAKKIR